MIVELLVVASQSRVNDDVTDGATIWLVLLWPLLKSSKRSLNVTMPHLRVVILLLTTSRIWVLTEQN